MAALKPERSASTQLSTIKLISLQNELLLSIGESLHAREVIHSFMQRARNLLNLESIHLYSFHEGPRHSQQIEHDIAAPHGDIRPHNHEKVMTLLQQFTRSEARSFEQLELNHTHYLAYSFHPYGVLLLVKKTAFAPGLPEALISIVKKLARHYKICIQHKQLKDQISNIQDIRKSYEQQAKQDPLTNLPNRREFRYALYQEIAKAQRYHVFGALLYIDLDNFKHINDSLGHSVGDILLTQIAEKLKAQARAGDSVYRIGGDEFVYILTNIGDNKTTAVNTTQHVASRILQVMEQPVSIGEFSLHITPSIGIAIFPCDNENECDSESVLKHADTAMYRAKEQGRNRFEFFDPTMQDEANKRLIIEDHLRKAIAKDELHLAYQPIIGANNRIVGAESLIRWNNPTMGNITPNDFVYIAEESNLILTLSDWIVEHACAFASKLYKQLPKNSDFQYISINISPRQFIQQDFVDHLLDIINRHHAPTEFIKLEFTENVLAQNIDTTVGKMNRLIDHGIDFMLDDFGTGYSSLSYLHRLPVNILKIDKSFVSNIEQQTPEQRTIIDAILVMADKLDIKCLVEGVETEQDYRYMKSRNIYGMQGYYFHRPMADEQLVKLLLQND